VLTLSVIVAPTISRSCAARAPFAELSLNDRRKILEWSPLIEQQVIQGHHADQPLSFH